MSHRCYEYDEKRTESQNCLMEAQMALAEMNATVKEEGIGEVELTVTFPYYCKATDALVGSGTLVQRRFATKEEAKSFIRSHGYDNDEELTCHIFEPMPEPICSVSSDESVPF